jgi:hypothetical protein
MQLSAEDIKKLELRDLDPSQFVQQLEHILHSISATKIEKPCILGDGIESLSPIECNYFIELFNQNKSLHKSLFIPASGAATRMFKHLSAIQAFDTDSLAEEFIIRFKEFPFYENLLKLFRENGKDLDDMVDNDQWSEILSFISEEIKFTQLPKALIPFHQTPNGHRTALEEQVREGLTYIENESGSFDFHFTISPEITDLFEQAKAAILAFHDQTQLNIEFSYQDPQTDTPALKGERNFARDKNNDIIFRPAGHGALIKNLQELNGDIIFIKNIDNIAHEKWIDQITFYKKVLGGLLIDLKNKTHLLLLELESDGKQALPHAIEFLYQQYGYRSLEEPTVGQVYAALNKPIRVCGMVRNEGEPGGGPFWVLHHNGQISKQIVEKNQIDIADPLQSSHISASTHFNPVDIVCCIKDHNGKKYDLKKFIDHSTSFISDKFQDGQIVKALELPGLWNGSMSGWNSVFVEVPSQTFHPVKTVNDLLRPGHK